MSMDNDHEDSDDLDERSLTPGQLWAIVFLAEGVLIVVTLLLFVQWILNN